MIGLHPDITSCGQPGIDRKRFIEAAKEHLFMKSDSARVIISKYLNGLRKAGQLDEIEGILIISGV